MLYRCIWLASSAALFGLFVFFNHMSGVEWAPWWTMPLAILMAVMSAWATYMGLRQRELEYE